MRFQFDERLLAMGREFEIYKERLRSTLIPRYDIKPSEAPMVMLK